MCYNRNIQISKKNRNENKLRKMKYRTKLKIVVTKKLHQKLFKRKVINNSLETPNVSNTETSVQEETEKNNLAENKTTEQQRIDGNKRKRKNNRFRE